MSAAGRPHRAQAVAALHAAQAGAGARVPDAAAAAAGGQQQAVVGGQRYAAHVGAVAPGLQGGGAGGALLCDVPHLRVPGFTAQEQDLGFEWRVWGPEISVGF